MTVAGSAPRTPRRGWSPDPRAYSHLYSLHRPAHHPHGSNNCSHSSNKFPCPHRVKQYTHLEVKAVMQTRVKFAALGRRWSWLSVISRDKNHRPSASDSHSRARQLAFTFDLVRRTSRSSAFPYFRLSTRNVLFCMSVLLSARKSVCASLPGTQ